MTDSPILNGWQEIAKFLGVSDETAMEWARSEGLPYSKIGGRIMTTTNALERWIVENFDKAGKRKGRP